VAGAAVGKVSILVFLDYFATNLFLERKALPKELYFAPQRVPKRGRYRKPEPVFWIKPFSKRFDVSILVFLDSPATLKILLHSHFKVCSHPIYIFRYGSWRKIFKDMTLKYTHGRRDGEDGAGNNDERSA